MDNKIRTINLQVGYGKNPVLKDVSFDLQAGQIICLIGANGAGKSTVLKTITRQLKKLNGNVYMDGEDEAKLTETDVAKKLSMVMTERIHPELMTCFDVVATGRYPYTGTMGILSAEDKKIAFDALKMVGAEKIAEKEFAKISDGQRQRIMLARAICQDTDIMILDEPTSFLDLQFKLDILKVIKSLAKDKNVAVLMSIHELEFVPAIADLVIGIAGDKVYKIGTPKEILTGENIGKMYRMDEAESQILLDGMWDYAKAITRMINA